MWKIENFYLFINTKYTLSCKCKIHPFGMKRQHSSLVLISHYELIP